MEEQKKNQESWFERNTWWIAIAVGVALAFLLLIPALLNAQKTKNNLEKKRLMIDATTIPEMNIVPSNKIYMNNDFSLTYSSSCTLTEYGYSLSSAALYGLRTLYELSIKEDEMNYLYITINRSECDYKELYDLSLKIYADSYISSTQLSPITISNIEGRVFNIKCEYQNITIFMIPTEYYTVMFQLFSSNETDYKALYAIINSFNLK